MKTDLERVLALAPEGGGGPVSRLREGAVVSFRALPSVRPADQVTAKEEVYDSDGALIGGLVIGSIPIVIVTYCLATTTLLDKGF